MTYKLYINLLHTNNNFSTIFWQEMVMKFSMNKNYNFVKEIGNFSFNLDVNFGV